MACEIKLNINYISYRIEFNILLNKFYNKSIDKVTTQEKSIDTLRHKMAYKLHAWL